MGAAKLRTPSWALATSGLGSPRRPSTARVSAAGTGASRSWCWDSPRQCSHWPSSCASLRSCFSPVCSLAFWSAAFRCRCACSRSWGLARRTRSARETGRQHSTPSCEPTWNGVTSRAPARRPDPLRFNKAPTIPRWWRGLGPRYRRGRSTSVTTAPPTTLPETPRAVAVREAPMGSASRSIGLPQNEALSGSCVTIFRAETTPAPRGGGCEHPENPTPAGARSRAPPVCTACAIEPTAPCAQMRCPRGLGCPIFRRGPVG
jgi:hypothetical protein